jgi:hypothetical protein
MRSPSPVESDDAIVVLALARLDAGSNRMASSWAFSLYAAAPERSDGRAGEVRDEPARCRQLRIHMRDHLVVLRHSRLDRPHTRPSRHQPTLTEPPRVPVQCILGGDDSGSGRGAGSHGRGLRISTVKPGARGLSPATYRCGQRSSKSPPPRPFVQVRAVDRVEVAGIETVPHNPLTCRFA